MLYRDTYMASGVTSPKHVFINCLLQHWGVSCLGRLNSLFHAHLCIPQPVCIAGLLSCCAQPSSGLADVAALNVVLLGGKWWRGLSRCSLLPTHALIL